jgi:hypothetical protein
MHQWLQRRKSNFYHEGMHAFVHKWKKIVLKVGDYTDNIYAFSNTVDCEIFACPTC